jgi:hypothetical protein
VAAGSKPTLVVSERCTRSCSHHPDNLAFSEDALAWYNEGRSVSWIVAESKKKGRQLSQAAISRHRKHLDEEAEVEESADGSVDHLKVLQTIIAQGAKRAHTWRVGPKETMDAMNMYYRLTQGSAMEGLLSALTAVAAGESAQENELPEHDAGSLSPAEMESVDADAD